MSRALSNDVFLLPIVNRNAVFIISTDARQQIASVIERETCNESAKVLSEKTREKKRNLIKKEKNLLWYPSRTERGLSVSTDQTMMLGCLLPFNEATCPEAMIFFEG
jgi:hypothetical protein